MHKVFLCIVPFLTAVACAHDVILEAKDVQAFKTQVLSEGPPTTLHISGLAFRSHMSVKKIEARQEGPVTVVLVYLFLARPGTSGTFQYDLVVPDSVTEVKFGKDRTLIWKREAKGEAQNLLGGHA